MDKEWVMGVEETAPGASTVLVSRTVAGGKKGYIFGFEITAQEANDFTINWTSGGVAHSTRIVLGTKGTLYFADEIPYNDGRLADAGTVISIKNVNAAAATKVYSARILYGERSMIA